MRRPGRRPLVVVGDALLDRDLEGRVERLSPDAPAAPVVDEVRQHSRPGGAALAATLASVLDGHQVLLVTALAGDRPGQLLAELLGRAGVEVVDLGLAGATPEKVRVRSEGRTLLRLDRGGRPGPVGAPGPAALRALASARAVLVADYGRGITAEPGLRIALADIAPLVPLVWDPHRNGSAPVAGVRLVTPNRSEVAGLAAPPEGEASGAEAAAGSSRNGARLHTLVSKARVLAARWNHATLAVTLGERGALLVGAGRQPLLLPTRPVRGGDSCGAGDRFAGAVAALLGEGVPLVEAVAGAVRTASAFVADGGAAGLELRRDALVLPYDRRRHKEVVPGDSG